MLQPPNLYILVESWQHDGHFQWRTAEMFRPPVRRNISIVRIRGSVQTPTVYPDKLGLGHSGSSALMPGKIESIIAHQKGVYGNGGLTKFTGQATSIQPLYSNDIPNFDFLH